MHGGSTPFLLENISHGKHSFRYISIFVDDVLIFPQKSTTWSPTCGSTLSKFIYVTYAIVRRTLRLLYPSGLYELTLLNTRDHTAVGQSRYLYIYRTPMNMLVIFWIVFRLQCLVVLFSSLVSSCLWVHSSFPVPSLFVAQASTVPRCRHEYAPSFVNCACGKLLAVLTCKAWPSRESNTVRTALSHVAIIT